MIDGDKPTRRDALKAMGAMGVVGLAGCTDDDGTHTFTLAGTSSGSSTQAAGNAAALAASEHSDSIDVTVQETGGWTANIYDYDAGDFESIGVDTNSMAKAFNDEDPFDEEPVESIPDQGPRFTSLEMIWVAMEGSGIESTADLREGGYTIYPIEPGFGTRLITEEVLTEDGIFEANEINNENTDDIPGAVEEGRVDALCVYGSNGIDLAGWCQEVDVRSDGELYVIETDDHFRDTVDSIDGARAAEFEPYGWEQDVTSELGVDEVFSWVLDGMWAFHPDIPAEATYEFTRVMHEHHDTMRDSDPTVLDYEENPEDLSAAVIDDIPVHPGVAEYWQDIGIWDDDWVEG
ncbi:TAXI family TRAP transporter solute-binding subunit [Halorubrum gandharaense]